MKKVYLLLNLACLIFFITSASAQTTTYSFTTGSVQYYTVPAGATQISVDVIGAKGGPGVYNVGGAGGRVQVTLNVTPAQVYSVYVGSTGSTTGPNTGTNGMNGLSGHIGGAGTTGSTWSGGGGGGATEIWFAGSPIIVAGAGGGGSGDCTSDHGGLGGSAIGGNGIVCGSYNSSSCGAGGNTTTSSGGAAGTNGGGSTAGGLYYGGNANTSGTLWAGGGGAGYYGGGGGSYYGGGGGGSSFPATAGGNVVAVTHTQGYNNTGNGSVVFTVLCSAPGTITGTLSTCVGSTTALANPTGASGGTWVSGNTAVGTISSSGVVTGISAGTTTVTYQLSSPCGGTSATAVVTVNPVSGAITGTASMCLGSGTTLSASPSGGTWSSNNTGVATVGSATGAVSSVAAGTATITYNLNNGCTTSTKLVTVNPQPAAITGSSTICGGTVPTTVTLSDGTSGGTWTSGNTAIATIGSTTGVVTGVSSGTAPITYTLPAGCFSTASVPVNAVANISGTPSVCLGSTITLTDATSGGTWSSSNTAIASISSGGVVTGVALGSAVVSYTVASMGCSAVVTVNVTNPPTTYAVTGGGSYCAGGTGVHIGVNATDAGISYSLFNGATLVMTLTGTGSALDFGLLTASGTYTVVANYGTLCAANMSGSAVVSVNALPTAFSVSGGGAYCAGGSGVHIYLSSSTIGVNYQLMLGSTPIGSVIAGTSSALDFGLVTTAGTYTVVGTNASTYCVNTMAGSATVSISPLPTAFSVTGGGGYCLGGSGVHIGLSGSASGTNYQLLISGSPVSGGLLSGTGSALDFGLITTGGSYTISATTTATGCSNSMSGTVTVTVNPLPTAFTVTGGGAYCLGGAGVAVGLNSSTAGVNYQLVLGSTPVGSPVAGTGAAISFGLQTTVGSYTVIATNATTGCVNNMTGSVSVSTSPLPTVFSVTGGGGYCAGGTGVLVGLSGSTTGTTYQLYNGATLVGAASGTGGTISFGFQLAAGTYTVVATNTATGCVGNMSGSVTVTINPLPTVFTVTGGGTLCAGGTGVAVGLNGSVVGVNYQLFNGPTLMGAPVAGTGSPITFGLQTAPGSYTVVATNATTTCSANMSGSVAVIVNPLPTVYTMTGGGGYCAGGLGVHVGLSASNTGISYQLMSGGPVGSPLTGTGTALDFGWITTAGTYTVIATNTGTGCANSMSGSSVVVINPLPTAYTLTSVGTSYCAGGTGVVVGLSNSVSGVNYQLYVGSVATGSAVAGTGSAISFGAQTAGGVYTAVGTVAATACSANMLGSITITVNPLPGAFAVTGGGSYCAGGTGVLVGLSGSAAGISYQLMNGPATVGSPVLGTGSALSFGLQTTAGTYTVVATNTTTGCTSNMTGTATVNINPLPALFTITGGGNYCAGGTGVHVGLSGSVIGNTYQLYVGSTPVGAPLLGTGLALDFGWQTTGGTYTVVATNSTTGCSSTMTGTTTVVVNALPTLYTVTGGGNYCVGGAGVVVGLDGSNTGISYQLYNGTTPVGTPVSGITGSPISFGLQTAMGMYTVVATNTTTMCSATMTGSASVSTYPLPVVYNVTGGGNYCTGGAGVVVGLSGSNTGISYQLMLGTAPTGAPVTGTGLAISFGLQTGAGTYTVVAMNTTTGCTNTMNGSAVVGINALPTAYTVTGGGNYCAGGTGLHIGLSGSNTGMTYRLYLGITPVGAPIAGTGAALDFGLKTAAGIYTVVATNVSTTCTNTMTGSVTIAIDPLPTAYTLSGGGNYCSGGAGLDLTLSNSDAGVTYQLYNGTSMVGTSMAGTGSGLDFGFQTAAGTYTVMATDNATGCTSNTATVTIGINPLPTTYIVGGGGNYCAGGAGLHVTLSGSNAGITYQLMLGSTPVGGSVAGTGLGLDFGLQTAGGVYTVVATNTATGCVNTMTGSVNVVVNPLPTAFSVSSTSSTYCAGGAGVHVWLNSSETGVDYQLYNGSTAVGVPVSGTGTTLDFGFWFAAGSYSIVGVNATTGCVRTMTSSITIVVNPLPVVYTVTGGGGYCNGSAGVHVGLSGSNSGISYELYRGGVGTGTIVSGTGFAIDFGLQTVAGAYTVVATNTATTCTSNMSGTATVVVNPVPAVFAVTGGGNYCAGGTGVHVGLNGSTLGVNYQLFRGVALVGGPVAGTGGTLDFGLQTTAGTYTVVGTNAMTACNSTMAGSVTIAINPAPVAYSVTGGGNFCPAGSGVHVGLSGTDLGINYQLYNGTVMVGSAVAGSGAGIDFGLQTAPGNYTVMATNTTTGCIALMSGMAVVGINPLPIAYNVVGGGNYCAGGAGVHVGLSNSQAGVNYTLYASTAVVTVPGTGGPIDFGLMTAAGTYTVIATNATTGCSNNMTGSVTIVINPVVAPHVVFSTGSGDTVCDGTFITFTATAINGGTSPAYQWNVNGTPSAVGSVYSYMPTNGDVVTVTLTSSEACASPTSVSSTHTMTVDPRQTPVVTVTPNPGSVVCKGTSVTFTATPSFGGTAPTYSWFKNSVAFGSSPVLTYVPDNGDIVYCVMTSNYHCRLANTATSTSINMEVDVPALPIVTITANPGQHIAAGQTVTFTTTVVNGGPSPSYQWLVNGNVVSGATTPTFVSSSINDDDSVTCQVLSSGGCPGLLGFNSVRMHVSGVGVQQINSSTSDIKLIPNPNKGVFTIKGTLNTTADEDVSIEITNMLGQVVYTTKVQARNGDLNERVQLGSSVANGMYILNLRSGSDKQIFHIVVEQ